MSETQLPTPRVRNMQTYQRHRHEVLRQITIPLIIAIIVTLVPALFITLGGSNVRTWADISIIWMSIPVLFFTLIALAITGGSAFLVIKLIQVLPPYTKMVQDFFIKANMRIRQASNIAVEPVLRVSALNARWKAVRNRNTWKK